LRFWICGSLRFPRISLVPRAEIFFLRAFLFLFALIPADLWSGPISPGPTMGATAVSSSTLNPDAPLFIPAAFLQVEDFSPQWWDLVTTTAWFRDHWSREHSHLDDMAQVLDAAALLPDDDDLFLDHAPAAAVLTAQHPPAPAHLKTGKALFLPRWCYGLTWVLQVSITVSSSAYVYAILFLCRCCAQGAEPGFPQGQ
jgi:hypothetical protein